MLTLIDASDPGVLSSQANIKMQQRIINPTLSVAKTYQLNFPATLSTPKNDEFVVSSTEFILQGQTCTFKNKLGTNILQIISVTSGRAVVDNAGNYDAGNGTIIITGFAPSAVLSNEIKISVIPGNQGFVSTIRENKLGKDTSAITVTAIETTTL